MHSLPDPDQITLLCFTLVMRVLPLVNSVVTLSLPKLAFSPAFPL